MTFTGRHGKILSIVSVVVGVAVVAGLIAHFGVHTVGSSLLAFGWQGFAAILCIHLLLIGVMGLAWRALLPRTRSWIVIWGRLVRDSASEILPLSQIGGYVLGARALTLAGISATRATGSTIVDVTLEFVAQLAYTGIGLFMLLYLRPGAPFAMPTAAGLGIAVFAAGGFLIVQHRGFALFDRLIGAIGRRWAIRGAAGAAALHIEITAIYRRWRGIVTSFFVHLGCWIASVVEAWIALKIAGVHLNFSVVLVIESLIYAVRAIAFAVPNAVGVQEAAYIVLGAGFGLRPDMALALSLLKRARDFAIGLPVLGVWQAIESRRLWWGYSTR